MATAAKGTEQNPCKCDGKLEKNHSGICDDTDCPKCYCCCGPGCTGCIILCKDAKDGICKCNLCGCECQQDEKVRKGQIACHESTSNKCNRCKDKCKGRQKGDRCICYLCNCGCNGVNCQCCRWCNPVTKCNGKCDRTIEHSDKCSGKIGGTACGKDNVGKYYCVKHREKGGCDIGKDCKFIFYATGGCRFPCTNCGKLCSQDICRIWLGVIVIVSLILSSLFVMRRMYPEKFQSMMTKIRAAFHFSPQHPGRPLSNLVGGTISAETNIDRYPAFRQRAYAGLS